MKNTYLYPDYLLIFQTYHVLLISFVFSYSVSTLLALCSSDKQASKKVSSSKGKPASRIKTPQHLSNMGKVKGKDTSKVLTIPAPSKEHAPLSVIPSEKNYNDRKARTTSPAVFGRDPLSKTKSKVDPIKRLAENIQKDFEKLKNKSNEEKTPSCRTEITQKSEPSKVEEIQELKNKNSKLNQGQVAKGKSVTKVKSSISKSQKETKT